MEFQVGRDVKLTGESVVIGTPQYMAPECILNPDAVDARADSPSRLASSTSARNPQITCEITVHVMMVKPEMINRLAGSHGKGARIGPAPREAVAGDGSDEGGDHHHRTANAAVTRTVRRATRG